MTRFLVLALFLASSVQGADSFRFGPFSLDSAQMRDLAARGAGRHAIRMLPEEVQEHVFYLEATVDRGVTQTVRLSLEEPASPGATFESRHPACAPILADLARRYGKPAGPEISSEEALENRKYIWKTAAEELALVCGRYQRRTATFAMDVILKRRSAKD